MDLEKDSDFQKLDVEVISIALDPAAEQRVARDQFGISSPMLIDENAQVSAQYDVLRWAIGNGEPGHTFVLVNKDGTIAWIRDYGAPDLADRTMYVEPDELTGQIKASLAS